MGETEQMLNHNFSFKAITLATRESQGQGSSGKKPQPGRTLNWFLLPRWFLPPLDKMFLVGARSKEG